MTKKFRNKNGFKQVLSFKLVWDRISAQRIRYFLDIVDASIPVDLLCITKENVITVFYLLTREWTRSIGKGAIGLVLIMFLSVPSAMASHVEDAVKARQEVMKHMGTAMKNLTPIFAQKVAWDEASILKYANTIKDNVQPDLLLLYQSHISSTDGSRSKIKIESSWEDFELRMNELSRLTGILLTEIPQGHDSALYTFKTIVKSCSGCHKRYRNKINDR